jgi:hypothetical protein
VGGYQGSRLFHPRALKLVWDYAQGVPRKINVLCENALLTGYALGKKTIDTGIVLDAIGDLCGSVAADAGTGVARSLTRRPSPVRKAALRFGPAMAASLALVAAVALLTRTMEGPGQSNLPERVLRASATQLTVWRPDRLPIPAQPAAFLDPAPLRPPLAPTQTEVETPAGLPGPPAAVPRSAIEHAEQPAVAAPPGPSDSLSDRVPPATGAAGSESARTDDSSVAVGPSTSSRAGPEQQTPGLERKPAVVAADEPRDEKIELVTVQATDMLYKILLRAYRRYDSALLRAVLQENPEIRDPDRIKVGQIIRLPKG